MTNANATESTKTIAVYGATGVTGGHLLAELNRRGISPILVGRNAGRMHAAATAAGLLMQRFGSRRSPTRPLSLRHSPVPMW